MRTTRTIAGIAALLLAGCANTEGRGLVVSSLPEVQDPVGAGDRPDAPTTDAGEAEAPPRSSRVTRNWEFQVKPYVIFTSIEGDAGVGRIMNAPVDVDFGNILETLELGGMLHAEAHHESGWGVLLDYAFMDLSADKPGPLNVVLDADVRQGVLEGFVNHRWHLDNGTIVDAFGGIRWWDIDLDVALSPGPFSRSSDIDWIDPVIGGRVITPIADQWSFLARVDFGGFGIESDFSWTLESAVEYRFTDLFGLSLGYKALSVDYEEGVAGPGFFAYDTVTHGPLIGFSFDF